MKKVFVFMLFLVVGLSLQAKMNKVPLITYKCDDKRDFQVRKIDDDSVELRTRYDISRIHRDKDVSGEVYRNGNYELGIMDDSAYLNIFGYFSAQSNNDFNTFDRNNPVGDSTYINELYRGCKVVK